MYGNVAPGMFGAFQSVKDVRFASLSCEKDVCFPPQEGLPLICPQNTIVPESRNPEIGTLMRGKTHLNPKP